MDYNISIPSSDSSVIMSNNLTFLEMNNTSSLEPLFYHSTAYQIVGTISLGIILSVGFTGNFFVMLVLILSPKLHTPTNCYLVSLSASDILVLLSTTTLMLLELYIPYNHWVLGSVVCQFSVCLQYLSVAASALSICAFSVERWVGICYPMRAHYMCTVSRAVKIIVGIWIFAILYNIHWIFMTTTVTREAAYGSYTKCTYRVERSAYKAVYMCDLILFYVLPLCITSVMYIQISWRLFRNDNRGLPLTGQTMPIQRPLSSQMSTQNQMSLDSQQHAHLWKAFSRVKARKQVVKLLMLIVILFASFWLPYRSMVVYNSFFSKGYHDLWFRMFARIMAFLNSACNPILYNAMSRKFRRSLKRLLKHRNKP